MRSSAKNTELRTRIERGLTDAEGRAISGTLDASRFAVTTLPLLPFVRTLKLSGCKELKRLPSGLKCYELDLAETTIAELPADLSVDFRLNLSGNDTIQTLPENFKVGSLNLARCVSITSLPEGLDVKILNLADCTSFRHWPQRFIIKDGEVDLRNCINLTYLPDNLGPLAQLNLAGCQNIHYLPDDLVVQNAIDIADTGLTYLPAGCQGAQIRWRGVPITAQIAFEPDTLSVEDIFLEENTEIRRVMIERLGYEQMLAQSDATILDTDQDPGGNRQLMRVDIKEDEPLVCLVVSCPSTGRRYALRVPPATATCHAAAAWIAGFDNPDDYKPLLET